MPSYLKGVTIQLACRKADLDKSWTREKLKTWIEYAGGRLSSSKIIDSDITHLVCSKDRWSAMKDDCERIWGEAGQSVIVVTVKWLEQCLDLRKKVKVKDFQLNKPAAGPSRSDELRNGPTNGIKNLVDVFTSATAGSLSAEEQAAIDAEIAQQRAIQEEDRLAAARDADRAHKQLLSKEPHLSKMQSDYHRYTGPDGFMCDILLVKSDVYNNKSQQTYLTIYESNAEPHVYAVVARLVKDIPRHTGETTIACERVNFYTARLQFLTIFEELTYLEWPQRRETFKCHSDVPHADKPWVYRSPLLGPAGELESVEI